jgi:hypothetical protein
MPINVANRLVAKVSRLYAEAAPEDQLALRVWMRDIILGRKVGSRKCEHDPGKKGRKADGQGV